jgi:hypothetical protein
VPFQVFGAVMLATTLLALAIGRRRLDGEDPSLMIEVPVAAETAASSAETPSSATDPAKEMA